MQKTLLAVLLALSSTTVFAADYYVVVPSLGKKASPAEPAEPPAPTLTLTLNGYPLPAALVGQAYSGFDFNTVLQVSGDASFDSQAVSWSVVGGALPEGLTLGADGVLSGTPTAAGNASFQVKASYKTADGTQTYQVLASELVVSLAAVAAPPGVIGMPYSGLDLNPLVSITGDAAYTGSGLDWAVVAGALPAGLTLSNGIIGGTPTAHAAGPATVEVRYKGKAAQQSLSFALGVQVKQFSGYRAWSDGTFAETCLDYVQGKPGYSYAGTTGSGIYRINPGGQPANVFCDMTTEGGGWTVVMVSRDRKHYPGSSIMESTDAQPPVPGQGDSVYLPKAVATALASKASTVRFSEPGTSKAIWSAHPVVMGNLRAGRLANYTTETVADPSGYWNFSGTGFTQLSHTCASWLAPEQEASGWYPRIYWGCGNTLGLHLGAGTAAWAYEQPNAQMVVSYR